MREMTRTERFVPEQTIRRIKARLYVKKITHKDIAKVAGVKVETVRPVLGGFCKSRNIMNVISKLLGDASMEKTWGKAA